MKLEKKILEVPTIFSAIFLSFENLQEPNQFKQMLKWKIE